MVYAIFLSYLYKQTWRSRFPVSPQFAQVTAVKKSEFSRKCRHKLKTRHMLKSIRKCLSQRCRVIEFSNDPLCCFVFIFYNFDIFLRYIFRHFQLVSEVGDRHGDKQSFRVREFLTDWLKQSGVPVVTVTRQQEKISVKQRRFYIGGAPKADVPK